MKYNIENKTIFDPEYNTLTNADSNAKPVVKIDLSRPTSRLLLELIRKSNVIVSREEILRQAWANYGAIASESNLNNHLSLLRRHFDYLGIDRKKLITIPRKGIMLKALVEEIIPPGEEYTDHLYTESDPPPSVKEEKPKEINHSSPTSPLGELVLPGHEPPPPLNSSHTIPILAIGLLILIISFAGFIVTPKNNLLSQEKYYEIGKCHIYPIRSGFIQLKSELENRNATVASLRKLVVNQEISCDVRKDIFVARRPFQKKFYTYVSECIIRDESNYSTCQGRIYVE